MMARNGLENRDLEGMFKLARLKVRKAWSSDNEWRRTQSALGKFRKYFLLMSCPASSAVFSHHESVLIWGAIDKIRTRALRTLLLIMFSYRY